MENGGGAVGERPERRGKRGGDVGMREGNVISIKRMGEKGKPPG